MKQVIGFIILLAVTCCSLPRQTSQLYIPFDAKKVEDSIRFTVRNISQSPIRVYFIESEGKSVKRHVYVLNAKSNHVYAFKDSDSTNFKHAWRYGNPEVEIKPKPFVLPFTKGKTYKVQQGFNGAFSHRDSDFSRYAIDFNLAIDDTICAADNGYVVGVKNQNTKGGNNRKWYDYANFITLYHPHSGLYTQYVHLQKNGTLVKLNDEVKRGQAIALSGNTGYTSGPHLHFNVLKPTDSEQGLISIPFDFEEYKGEKLEKGSFVTH